ncbi:translation initiation factor eIF3 subunit I [Saccharomycopsis crataegensis]|uniref:Eukaryotic translation initiation factor 3 subunit I n=1 Tax=Saccharomycopsis crataegensis TaxID=43959 RepID=A0AAV5QF66_9ASCO|nr:translation initiation factor eIF3 subunit I [Saccharomycopsis crataegensis]
MRPILLKGHERSLTQVKFNKEGDLILSVGKDTVASIWYSFNGERLGTLKGHSGTIWTIDVSEDSKLAITGSADFSAKLWNVETGECLFTWSLETPVRRVEFNPYKDEILMAIDAVMGFNGRILVFKLNKDNLSEQSTEPILDIPTRKDFVKAMIVGYSYGGKYIVAGHQDGVISKYDAENGKFMASEKIHEKQITDIQFSEDRTYFITSSKDKTACLVDTDSFKVLKTYETDAPMNSATITPVKDFVVLGGGQEARDVTTTSAKQGKFEARFFHKVFQDEIGRVAGHFGPLNYVAMHPNGSGYASGGEDGFIRLHYFEKHYFDFKYDVELTANSSLA